MRFSITLSPPVESSRFREVAGTPLCHADKVFERSSGDYWLETTENLYQLVFSQERMVTGVVSREQPCAEFNDLVECLGLTVKIEKAYDLGEPPDFDWENIAEKYKIEPIAPRTRACRQIAIAGLRPVEAEVLRAIQTLAGPFEQIDVNLFAHGFASNLSVTLHSLARKRFIIFSPETNSVRLNEDAQL